MKTFEELQDVIHSIAEMEGIFQSVVLVGSHQKKIQRYTELKDEVFDILVRDVKQNTDV